MQDSKQITFIDESDYPLWDQFVMNSPQGSFFYTTSWANVLRRSFRRQYKIAVCHKKELWLGGTLYFVNKKFGLPLITPLPLHFYNAPVFYRPEKDEKNQKTLAYQLEITDHFVRFFSKHYRIWILSTSTAHHDMRAYQWHNCLVTPEYSYVLHLNHTHKTSENYSQSARRKLNRAEQFEPVIEEHRDGRPFLELYRRSYERHGIRPLISSENLQRLIQNLLDLPDIKLYYLKFRRQIVAGRIICSNSGMLYDILAGSIDETGTGSTLLLDFLLNKYRSSCKTFDFMGAGHPLVEQFKRGFGPDLVHGFRIVGNMRFPFSMFYRLQLKTRRRRRQI